MGLTAAEKQQRYRERHLGIDGAKLRIQLFVGVHAKAQLPVTRPGPPRSLRTSPQARRPGRAARLPSNHSRAPRKRPAPTAVAIPDHTGLVRDNQRGHHPTATTAGAVPIVVALSPRCPATES